LSEDARRETVVWENEYFAVVKKMIGMGWDSKILHYIFNKKDNCWLMMSGLELWTDAFESAAIGRAEELTEDILFEKVIFE